MMKHYSESILVIQLTLHRLFKRDIMAPLHLMISDLFCLRPSEDSVPAAVTHVASLCWTDFSHSSFSLK